MGRFILGALFGGVVVVGGLIVSSALFPPTQAVTPANDNAAEVAAPEAVTPDAGAEPSPEPSPVVEPTPEPTAVPTPEPTAVPTPEPTAVPTPEPTAVPTPEPTPAPVAEPTPAAAEPVAPEPAPATDTAEAAATADEPTLTEPAPATAAAEPDTMATESDPVAEAAPAPEQQTEVTVAPEALDPEAAPAVAEAPAALEPPAAEIPPEPPAPEATTLAEAPAALEPPPALEPQTEAAPDVSAAEAAPDAAAEAEIAEALPEPELLPEPEVLPEAAPEALPEAEPPVAEAPEAAPEGEPEAAALPGDGAPAMPGTRPEGLPGSAPEADTAEAAAEAPETGDTFKPAPGLTGAAEGVVVGRLPKIGADPGVPAPAAEGEAPAPDSAEGTTADAAPEDDRPIARFAVPFERTDDKPLLSIVLVDTGAPEIDRTTLTTLPFHVTIALDPMLPDTPTLAAAYRAAGMEVVMLATGVVRDAQPSDVAVAFQAMEQGLPEAVAVMDLATPTFQDNRPLASIGLPVVKDSGRGLLTWDQGLNAADQVAQREDVPAATIFRDIGPAVSDKFGMRRLMDRAIFKADQDGSATVVGPATPEMAATLMEWAVEGRSAPVTLAPLTAVLTIR